MSETSIDIIINGLQAQLSELKEVISGLNNDQNTSAQTTNMKPIADELDALKITNTKLNYRITQLLRALDEKDSIISSLKDSINK
ncbi:12239_t:CDS:2 [Funneliformis geosporum]|uniref:7374_t:CDS:1 n=1 Tax=Funneliformis geosporum TaxID=1117311 RepID=A0A9W4SB17_9GLOM|nr:7374_t:CDS:2 [Funneliformis geosporum]CAI2162443.1 12239_t:CDS:2 [Funneliformis geosporum]